ncbi:MAG: iron-sulfur cluster assembly protein, partial [Candidatus Hydrogenedentota bacterium]
MVTEEQVLDSMRHIIDPDLGKDIVSLGFIKNITIEGGRVRFTVELTTPACPVKEEFRHKCKEAVEALEGVEAVEVELSSMKPRQKTEQHS